MSPSVPARLVADFVGYLLLFRSAPDHERPSVGVLRNHLLAMLEAVARRVVDPREGREIRFALVAFADELIMHSTWCHVADWKRETLGLLMLGNARAGNDFFKRLDALPDHQLAAREVYFLCLLFGFQGEHAGDEALLRELILKNYEMLRAAGRAIDASILKRVAAPAYDVQIELRPAVGKRVWPRVLATAAGVATIWAIVWLALWIAANGVPLPGGLPG